MSKRYKGKACAYCAQDGVSESADHIFAREFFPVDQRKDLPKVPACSSCNGVKSVLEHYLATVLPFAGNHPASSSLLESAVPGRLAQNQRLYRELAAGPEQIWVTEGGLVLPSLALPFDGAKLAELFGMIARGLIAFHWKMPISPGYAVRPGMLIPEGERFFEQLLAMNGHRVKSSLGDGIFQYEGVQSFGDPGLTVWRFDIYGGLKMVDGTRSSPASAERVWVTTSRPALPNLFGAADEAQSASV